MKSFFDHDAPEIDHPHILWNYISKCVKTVDCITKNIWSANQESDSHEKESLANLKFFRHTVQDVVNKLSLKENNSDQVKSSSLENKKVFGHIPVKEWIDLMNDIDVCLHEFSNASKLRPSPASTATITGHGNPAESPMRELAKVAGLCGSGHLDSPRMTRAAANCRGGPDCMDPSLVSMSTIAGPGDPAENPIRELAKAVQLCESGRSDSSRMTKVAVNRKGRGVPDGTEPSIQPKSRLGTSEGCAVESTRRQFV